MSTVGTSDELWQATSIRDIDGSVESVHLIDPRYKRWMSVEVTRGKSTYILLSIFAFRSTGRHRHGAKVARTNPKRIHEPDILQFFRPDLAQSEL